MGKKGSFIFWVSIILAVLLIIIAFLYFALFKPQTSGGKSVILNNPVSGLTDEQAVVAFNESFVIYLLYSIKAYNLHNPPLSSNYPKLEIDVGGDIFSANVQKGAIYVSKNEIFEEDVIIRTTKEEAVKMLRDKNYVVKSFNDGKSGIELVASKTTLFAKGYLNMYTELTGKSITGNLIRIASD
ncbi:hypothetical protein J4229_02280 [Candidatus Pacearchaeota archaeon]|nr:hypothetical protein [Candidatus Pacearchaeota archaeon]